MDTDLEKLQAAFAGLDQGMLEALQRLKELQALHQSLFEEESERLLAKLGHDHPRVNNIQVDFSHSSLLAPGLACTHVDSARIGLSVPGEAGLIVAGWVTDLEGRGAQDLSVSLRDRDRRYDADLATCLTDAEGFFALRFDPERLPDPPELRGEICIELIVDDRSGSRLYTSPEPFPCNTTSLALLRIRSGEAPASR